MEGSKSEPERAPADQTDVCSEGRRSFVGHRTRSHCPSSSNTFLLHSPVQDYAWTVASSNRERSRVRLRSRGSLTIENGFSEVRSLHARSRTSAEGWTALVGAMNPPRVQHAARCSASVARQTALVDAVNPRHTVQAQQARRVAGCNAHRRKNRSGRAQRIARLTQTYGIAITFRIQKVFARSVKPSSFTAQRVTQ